MKTSVLLILLAVLILFTFKPGSAIRFLTTTSNEIVETVKGLVYGEEYRRLRKENTLLSIAIGAVRMRIVGDESQHVSMHGVRVSRLIPKHSRIEKVCGNVWDSEARMYRKFRVSIVDEEAIVQLDTGCF